AEEKNDPDLLGREMLEHAEVEGHDALDEDPENQQELALLHEVGLAGIVDQLGDLEHGLVHGQDLELPEDHHPERETEDAHEQPPLEQRAAVRAAEAYLGEIRDLEIGLASALVLGGAGCALGLVRVERPTGPRPHAAD